MLPLLFIKTSLPPYTWDEAVYHYISPYTLATQQVWHFRTLYSNLPRLLETAFIGLFSITKTYATARLLHLVIFLSFQLSLFRYVKDRFSVSAAIIAILFINYFLLHLAIDSTLGYIDLGTTSFILVVWLIVAEAAIFKNFSLKTFLLFAGLAVGAKYNALSAVLVGGVLYLAVLLRSGLRYKAKEIILGVVLFFTFGGYWYVKNWWVTGNPVFPFLFACKNGVCQQGQSFFAWATPMGLNNLFPIISKLFQNIPLSQYLAPLVIFLALVLSKGSRRRFQLVIIGLLATEYAVVSVMAGFTLRYFYHWQIAVWLLLAMSIVNLITGLSKYFPAWVIRTTFAGLFMLFFIASIKTLLPEYQARFPGGSKYYETRFALHRMSVQDWILAQLPKTGQAVNWCERQHQPLVLTVKDPDILWSTGETKFPIFLTNCRHSENFVPGQPKYLVSASECAEFSSDPSLHPKDDERMRQLRQENQKLVCNSLLVVPGLYLVNDEFE